MKKTLVYCTGFAPDSLLWWGRYRPWLERMQNSPLHVDQILIVDDGSPVLPDWRDLPVVQAKSRQSPAKVHSDSRAFLYHFPKNLGRPEFFNFPGWHRSYAFGALYGASHGFERIIHLESDAVLLSDRIHRYFNSFDEGWISLWCHKYQFPEIAVQIAAGSGITAMADFAARPYSEIAGKSFEFSLPMQAVERRLIGGRFAETAPEIPRDHDYATQVPWRRQGGYHWWRPEPTAEELAERTLTLEFHRFGNIQGLLEEGWSTPEVRFRWMIDHYSRLRLPPFLPGSDCLVAIEVNPYLAGSTRDSQHLEIKMRDRLLMSLDLTRAETIKFVLPCALRRGDGSDYLEFFHPDAISPLDATGVGSNRVLAVAIATLTLSVFN